MQHPERYLTSLHLPPHMQPPMCLQYAILALAAALSRAHERLALPFYHRARNYVQLDEMRVSVPRRQETPSPILADKVLIKARMMDKIS